VYPKPGARRTERQEHGAEALHPDAKHQGSVFFAMAKEVQAPSRLRNCVNTHIENEAKKGPSLWKAAEETVRLREEEKRRNGDTSDEFAIAPPEVPKGLSKAYYPHASALRGNIAISKPRALDWGIDVTEAKSWRCPFWEAPYHRFEAVALMPGARPETPPRSLRWKNANDWENPDLHPPLKVTQTIPATNSMIQLSRSRSCA